MAATPNHPGISSVVVDNFDEQYVDAHPATLAVTEHETNGRLTPDSSEAPTPLPPEDEEDAAVHGGPIDITKWHGPTTSAEVTRLRNTRAKKSDELVEACSTMLVCLGEDINREGLLKTPQRMAKALQYFTSGYETCLSSTYYGPRQ